MRILIFLLFLLPLSLIGQVESQFNGTLKVFSASRIASSNRFTISGIFSSTTTSYTSANSAVGDIVQVQSGNRFYWMHIYSIAGNSGGVITCNVRDSSSTLTTFPTGTWSIFRPTPNLRLPLSPDGETNASRSATFNTLALRVDEIQTVVASATNCELTITKNAHGFRKWTPVFWNGSTYIRPTADSLVPDYIVVDSLTANTFKVATCGTYTTTLTNGLYWFTSASPGYSLTQDTTKVPLFQALNGKLILNPIVGFNLMSGSGSGDVTSSVLADTAAAIRADFPNNIINPNWVYVSKANGDNATAIAGTPLKAFADPFVAADSVEIWVGNGSMFNPTIFVLDGYWNFGPAGEASDVSNEDHLGLIRVTTIKWVWEQDTGVSAWRSPEQATADERGLFWTPDPLANEFYGTQITGGLFFAGGSTVSSTDPNLNTLGTNWKDVWLRFEKSEFNGYSFSPPSSENIPSGEVVFKDCKWLFYHSMESRTRIGTGIWEFSGLIEGMFQQYIPPADTISHPYSNVTITSSYDLNNLEIMPGNTSDCRIAVNSVNQWVFTNGFGVGLVNLNLTGGLYEHSLRYAEDPGNVTNKARINVKLTGTRIADLEIQPDCEDRLNIECHNCYIFGNYQYPDDTIQLQRAISNLNEGKGRMIITGSVDLQNRRGWYIQPDLIDFVEKDWLVFKDMMFINSPSGGYATLAGVYPNQHITCLGCYGDSNFTTENILIIGTPVTTY